MQLIRSVRSWLGFVIAVAASSVAFAGTSPPPFPGTYYFSGICADCANTPTPVTAKLVIGNSFNNSTFEYDSVKLGHIVATSIFNIVLGSAPIGPNSGTEDVYIQFLVDLPIPSIGSPSSSALVVQREFFTELSGDWYLGSGASLHDDIGGSGIWGLTPIPEPQTLAMWLMGLAALGAVARRKVVPPRP